MKKLLLNFLGVLVVLASHMAYGQNRTVTGTVTGADDGSPIPGVSVKIKGTTIGTQTGGNGKYSINAPAGSTLVFSFIGYLPKEAAIGKSTLINVTLALDAKQLGEVIVRGAGGLEVAKRAQGYTTTEVTPEKLTAGKATNVAIGLTGKVAGLQVNAVSSGVNPTVRIVLRGNRSLTGNNQALIVLDNVIVPNTIIGNINPEDIEDIQVLNGAGAAALYGTAASNGAIMITTKKGKKGETNITLSNTTSLEQISFYPKLQNTFGSGSTPNAQIYIPFENQQYGPAFDGSMKIIGKPLADGSIQTVQYSATKDKYNFWNTGITNQSDLAISSGSDKSTLYFSGQYVNVNGTTPKDKYNRAQFRLNGTREYGKGVSITYNANYAQNRYDQTTATSTIYNNLLNTPAQIPLTNYKDWQNDPFANPNGYYNEYYENPYFDIDNYRQKVRNDYFIGSTELKWKVAPWVDLNGRVGITTRNQSSKSTSGKFTYSDYTQSISSSKTNFAGGVSDEDYYNTSLYTDVYATFKKQVHDLNFNLTLGANISNIEEQDLFASATGIVIPGLYNISNRVGEAGATEYNNSTHSQSLYGDFKVSFKDYLFVEVTGRNDWTSLLAAKNRSFFYPSVNASFIPTQAFEFLKNSKVIDNIKIRGGLSKVGNVNVSPYALLPTFAPSGGFPYGSLAGYSVGNRVVSLDLRPEITNGYEVGTDFSLFKSRIDASVTFYDTKTKDQTVPVGVSTATGFSSYLKNTGTVENQGVEATLHFTPVRTSYGLEVIVGGNFTYNNNKVLEISSDINRLQLSTGSSAQVYAVAGGSASTLIGTDYLRDSQGRVIVDRLTGYPSVDPTIKVLGNTTPKQRLGLDFTVNYKGFRLSGLFEYRSNYVIFHSEGSTLDFSGAGYRTAEYNRERFIIPNSSYLDPATNTYVANTSVLTRDGGAEFWTSSSYNTGIATNYTTSGNYWKLREAALAYTLPAKLFVNNKYVKGATISLQGRNLFIWTPKSNEYTDPDYNFTDGNAIGISSLSQTPPTRYYGATVTVKF
jgi:TonB-linked SusC/RagA family outer membrane protein